MPEKGRLGLLRTAVWLQIKVRGRGLGLRSRLYTGLSVTTALLRRHIRHCGAI